MLSTSPVSTLTRVPFRCVTCSLVGGGGGGLGGREGGGGGGWGVGGFG